MGGGPGDQGQRRLGQGDLGSGDRTPFDAFGEVYVNKWVLTSLSILVCDKRIRHGLNDKAENDGGTEHMTARIQRSSASEAVEI